MYTENDIVKIAKRENNNKRKYLVINSLQGKHIPVSPSKAINMFYELGKMVKEKCKNEKILFIGFAETATAIGVSIAIEVGGYYIQTTREKIDNVEYLLFSEAHSHATEQKLVKNDIDYIIDKIDRIIFVEDEITTGNTIMDIIKIINQKYPNKIGFMAVSLINGMNKVSRDIFNSNEITTQYLVKTTHDDYEAKVEKIKEDGVNYTIDSTTQRNYHKIICNNYLNARRLIKPQDYLKECKSLWAQINSTIDFTGCKNILVLGTEEFMFPAMFVAKQIEDLKYNVLFHATTRSPIIVSKKENYPLHTRYELESVYEKDRITFLYNINQYDMVILITDTKNENNGTNSIINALLKAGNSTIYYVRWC